MFLYIKYRYMHPILSIDLAKFTDLVYINDSPHSILELLADL